MEIVVFVLTMRPWFRLEYDDDKEEEDSNKLKKEKLVEQPKQPRITKVNNKLQFKMKDQWAETLFNLKLIVNRLSSRDARNARLARCIVRRLLQERCAKVLISPTSSSTRESRDEHATRKICYYNEYQVVGLPVLLSIAKNLNCSTNQTLLRTLDLRSN
ncbi:hypothetical protein PI124_g2704 [Phytophthora idaei]|nr:hypothetical protein PI124_g2704 [Phytophthora idaei]